MNEKLQREGLPADLAAEIQLYLDGKISEAAFRELQDLLEREPEARAFYRSYSAMDSNLREISEESPGFEALAPMHSTRRSVGASLLQAAATFVLGAAFVYFVLGRRGGEAADVVQDPKPGGSIPAGEMIDNSLAILTRAVGVEWAEDAQPYRVGSVLPVDTLKVNKGLMQIEFFSGAIVIVEGPAEFELVDPMKAICHLGKTRANVPESAHGFTIGSKHMDVVDLGHRVRPGGRQRWSGRGARFRWPGRGAREAGREDAPCHVRQRRQDRSRRAGISAAQRDGVCRCAPRLDPRQSGCRRAPGALDELQRGTQGAADVLLYYSFDEKTTWSRELRNLRKMTANPLHGAIVGCRWSEGRWNGKGSLEFKGAGDRVRIQIPGEHEEFSLMAWVRIDGFDRELNSLMLSDNWAPGGVHWQFTREGELILGTKRESDHGHFQSPPVLNQSHLGHWIQLAVSYNANSKHVAHFLNGEPVWEEEMEHHIPISVPRGELGNWKTDYKQSGNNIRNLNGRMDEFVVFSRALSDS